VTLHPRLQSIQSLKLRRRSHLKNLTLKLRRRSHLKNLRRKERIGTTKKKKSWKQPMMRYHSKNGRHGKRRRNCKERRKNPAPKL
jgi:hypothetical protein